MTKFIHLFALLGIASSVSVNQHLTTKQRTNAGAITEMNRYIGSHGQPISLSQETSGHARIELCEIENKQNKNDAAKTFNTELLHSESGGLIAKIKIGSPPQELNAVFDTGSSNSWVNDKSVLDKLNKEGKNTWELTNSFDSQKSKTLVQGQQKVKIGFSSGAIEGTFVTDNFEIGQGDKKIQISQQTFGLAEKSDIFDKSFEVLIGLAYPSLAEKGVKPFFDQMIEHKYLKDNIFAFYMTSKVNIAKGFKSDLTFGYYDRAKYEGEIQWNPVKYQYMYGMQLDDLLINGKSYNLCKMVDECLVTIDSGSESYGIPTKIYDHFKKINIPLNQGIECQDPQKQYGSLTYVINGKNYEVKNEEWMYPKAKNNVVQTHNTIEMVDNQKSVGFVGPQEQKLTQTKIKSTDGQCKSKLRKQQTSKDMFILGSQFMQNYYSIFDRDQNRVGIAKSKLVKPNN